MHRRAAEPRCRSRVAKREIASKGGQSCDFYSSLKGPGLHNELLTENAIRLFFVFFFPSLTASALGSDHVVVVLEREFFFHIDVEKADGLQLCRNAAGSWHRFVFVFANCRLQNSVTRRIFLLVERPQTLALAVVPIYAFGTEYPVPTQFVKIEEMRLELARPHPSSSSAASGLLPGRRFCCRTSTESRSDHVPPAIELRLEDDK